MTRWKYGLTSLGRRDLLRQSAALGALTAAPSLITVAARAADSTTVNMQLGWLASNGILGEVVAKSKGFYDEEGITFEVTPGGPGVDGVASVAAGRSGVGQLSSSPSLMLARSAGIPVKAFAAGYQQHPFTYFSLAGDPIREPKDMIGKTIATQPTAMILLRALAGQERHRARTRSRSVNMGSDMNQLMTGQAAAVTGWLTNTNALEDPRRRPGRHDALGYRHPALCQRLLHHRRSCWRSMPTCWPATSRGSARGWGYARGQPGGGGRHAGRRLSQPRSGRASWRRWARCSAFSFGDDVTAAEGWAAMNAGQLAGADRHLCRARSVRGRYVPTVDDVMTTAGPRRHGGAAQRRSVEGGGPRAVGAAVRDSVTAAKARAVPRSRTA